MEKFLNLENLRVGLNDYLNTHKYGNAETKDLWNVLSKHANQSIEVKVSFFNGVFNYLLLNLGYAYW